MSAIARALLAAALLLPAAAPALHLVEGPEFYALAEGAEELARRGEYEKAFEGFTGLTRRAVTPEGRAYAWLRRAEVLERPGWWLRARAAHVEAAEALAGSPGAVTARYHVAVIDYEHLGRKTQALEALGVLMRGHPGSMNAGRALTRLAWEIDAGAPKLAFYRGTYDALGASELGPVILWRCGEAGEASRLWYPALVCYRRLVSAHPGSPFVGGALFQAAGVYRRLGLGEQALTLYRELLALQRPAPQDPLDLVAPVRTAVADDVWYAIGEVQEDLNKPDAAVHAYQELLRLYPTSRLRDDALWRLAGVQAGQGEREDARETLERLLRLHPRSRFAEQARAALGRLKAGRPAFPEAAAPAPALSAAPAAPETHP